jgi:GT2 family glycosyltransferase
MAKKVAVILVNWNSFDLTNECIESLSAVDQTIFDILVTDNGSADGSGDQLKQKHAHIILLKATTNLGFTGGNNLALEYSIANNYTYSMLLNNDTVVDPAFLSSLINFMDANPNAGAVQSRIFFYHNRNLLWNGGSFYNKWLGIAKTSGYNKPSVPPYNQTRKVDWITGCAFFTRNDILKQVGLLADNLFIYYEDCDLSFRIKEAGYSLHYIPESIVYHIAGMANRTKTKGKEGFLNPIVHYLNIRNKIWFLKQYTKPQFVPGVVLFNTFYFIAIIAYFAARLRFKKLNAAVKGIRDGLAGNIIYNETST